MTADLSDIPREHDLDPSRPPTGTGHRDERRGGRHTPGGDHPQDLSLRAQAHAIAAGELDATELLEATIARIEERDPRSTRSSTTSQSSPRGC